MGEMRKRVRNIGEYVTRSQIEAVDREKRMKLLGITPEYPDPDGQNGEEGDEEEEEEDREADAGENEADASAAEGRANGRQKAEAAGSEEEEPRRERGLGDDMPMSMRLMDELTRELIHFQRKFGVGPGMGGGSGVAT